MIDIKAIRDANEKRKQDVGLDRTCHECYTWPDSAHDIDALLADRGRNAMRTRLTKRRLEAIAFAMNFILAGDVDETLRDTGVTANDLDAAWLWVEQELLRRSEAPEVVADRRQR